MKIGYVRTSSTKQIAGLAGQARDLQAACWFPKVDVSGGSEAV